MNLPVTPIPIEVLGPRGLEGATLSAVDDQSLRVDFADGTSAVGRGNDLWEALLHLRGQLEPAGTALGVVGALPNVWPSGMSAQMSGGRKAYQHRLDGEMTIVDVLDAVSPTDTVSISAQEAVIERLRLDRILPPGGSFVADEHPDRPPDMAVREAVSAGSRWVYELIADERPSPTTARGAWEIAADGKVIRFVPNPRGTDPSRDKLLSSQAPKSEA